MVFLDNVFHSVISLGMPLYSVEAWELGQRFKVHCLLMLLMWDIPTISDFHAVPGRQGDAFFNVYVELSLSLHLPHCLVSLSRGPMIE